MYLSFYEPVMWKQKIHMHTEDVTYSNFYQLYCISKIIKIANYVITVTFNLLVNY